MCWIFLTMSVTPKRFIASALCKRYHTSVKVHIDKDLSEIVTSVRLKCKNDFEHNNT